ncbi:MAG: hypothetical protein IJV78_03385 [Clostridia bacterium]|nr:hypothetical protein [Clostridia bacterium]MBQ9706913.1 hypothetical protein [Clostridia bacterium]
MKKLMALLLAVMMLSTCLLVAACGGACKDGHTDANHDGVCDECATGDLEVQHEWKYTSGTKTTCTEAGTETYTCTVCSATDVKITKPAYGHTWEYQETVEADTDTVGGDVYKCSRCKQVETRNSTPAYGENPTLNADDYFRLQYVVSDKGGEFIRLESERNYDDVFVYNFAASKEEEIDALYADILAKLDAAERYDESKHRNIPTKDDKGNDVYDHEAAYYVANKEGFEHELYDPYMDYLDYVIEQYQYAYVFYCVYDDAEWEEKYNAISDYRTEMVKDYYALFRKIHETQFREFFFSPEEGWTEEDIQVALTMSDSYGKEEYAALNKRADEILLEFRDIKHADTDAKVLDLYEEFVGINNQIAALAGYDNYVEYAYENVYEREYSPADVERMRAFVKQYISPVYGKILTKYKSSGSYKFFGVADQYKSALLEESIFDSPLTANIVADYLSELNSKAFDKEINFYEEANKLFKNGNYFTGKHQGAFSYYIPAQNATILFFGPGSYSGAFTFVHEFGHYYQNIYNPGLSLNMDHDETQSQGNEMLMLAWLENYLDEKFDDDHLDLYTTVKYDNLFNSMAIVMLATAVDEFEQAVYTGSWGTAAQYREITKDEYDSLFEAIMKDYGIAGSLNSAYWRFVVIEAPCYYISYAMSALPSMGIYVKAQKDGFDAALDSYLKLFAFSDEESLCKVLETQDGDDIIDKEVTATYEEILNYCGLQGPFQEQLYIDLKDYLANE